MPHRSSVPPSWTIQAVTFASINEVLSFINHARTDMFPGRSLTPDDASLFGPGSFFLEARDGEHLIAVIGYVPYDHRFPQLDYHAVKTVEVVRLYVLPEYRRCGLAAALFSVLRERGVRDGVECFYLHTHPFLPGAVGFWEKRGFEVVQVEEDEVWRTTHMQLMLDRAQC